MEGICSKGTHFQKLTVSTNTDSRNTIYSRNSGYLSKQFCVYVKKLCQIYLLKQYNLCVHWSKQFVCTVKNYVIYHLLKLVKHISSCLIVDLQLVLTMILKRTRIIFKPRKSMGEAWEWGYTNITFTCTPTQNPEEVRRKKIKSWS